MNLFLCLVLGSVLISFFYMKLSSFPSTNYYWRGYISLLYILASFVKDKVPIGTWADFWAFCLVPLIYISVFVPVPYCLDDCSFVVQMHEWILKYIQSLPMYSYLWYYLPLNTSKYFQSHFMPNPLSKNLVRITCINSSGGWR